MARDKLTACQTSYAEAMNKYRKTEKNSAVSVATSAIEGIVCKFPNTKILFVVLRIGKIIVSLQKFFKTNDKS